MHAGGVIKALAHQSLTNACAPYISAAVHNLSALASEGHYSLCERTPGAFRSSMLSDASYAA